MGPSAEEGKLHGKLLLVTQSSIDRYVRSIDASQWAMGWLMRDATITPGRARPDARPVSAALVWCACVACRVVRLRRVLSAHPALVPQARLIDSVCKATACTGDNTFCTPRQGCTVTGSRCKLSLMWRTRSPPSQRIPRRSHRTGCRRLQPAHRASRPVHHPTPPRRRRRPRPRYLLHHCCP